MSRTADNRVTDELRASAATGRSRRFSSWLLVLPSILVGIVVFEVFCHFFAPSIGRAPHPGENFGANRIFFFSGADQVFRRYHDIFTFTPHAEIRQLTTFYSDHDYENEYDYHFRTDNLGLVNDADIIPGKASLLLLGDSFAEGLGAEPWFRRVSPEIERLGYQPINGGLMATGFKQWLKLDRYLAGEDVKVGKLVVLFISDDFRRPVWDLPPTPFYQIPPPADFPATVAKLRAERAQMFQRSWLEERAAALLPASYHVYEYFARRLPNPIFFWRFYHAQQESRDAIADLIKTYGADNVVFIHIPQKDEIHADAPNTLGLRARRSIEEAHGRLFDGFQLCGMTPSDFYPNDDHPNVGGYAKIAACVTRIIDQTIPALR